MATVETQGNVTTRMSLDSGLLMLKSLYLFFDYLHILLQSRFSGRAMQ